MGRLRGVYHQYFKYPPNGSCGTFTSSTPSNPFMSSTSPTPTRSYPFAIANAFTQDPFGGNPATVIFLDKSTTLTQEERLKFVNGFNQPMVVFLTPTSSTSVTEEERGPGEEAVAIPSFDIQYFTSTCEVELCGHGALAAMKVILDSATDSPGFGQNSQFPAFSSSKTHTVEFTTAKGIVISARKVVIEGEEWFEIVLPAIKVEKLPAEEEKRVLDALASAIGKEPRVKYIGKGVPPFERYLLIVLEESENLEQLRFVDIQALVGKTQAQEPPPSPILTPAVNLDIESNWVRKPCGHHRFDEWEIS